MTSAEGLKNIAKLVNEEGKTDINITLTDNIDLTGIDWTPIGIDYNHQYTGTFNGGGHTITGLTVTGSDQYVGLFGHIGSGGKVMNVKLEGVQIESDNETSAVGGVAGWSYGNIENCSVSGSVSGSGMNGVAGGVVGYQTGGSITGCSSSATVKGVTYAGGVVGLADGGATLTACYAWGSVTGSGSGTVYVGGVTGTNDVGTLTACYHAKGTVSGPDGTTGGVAGRNYKYYNDPVITACYWGGNGQTQGIGYNQAGTTDGIKQVTDGNWSGAKDAMNTALSGTSWQYVLGTDGLPVLEKNQ